MKDADGGDGHALGFGSRSYRSYVLNFVDRGLLSVVAPQMKPELGLSDTAFGLLTGFGFALLYTLVGVPLAQVAETRHRVWIMTVCVALWSLMTAMCGLAADVTVGSVTIGAFWILLICRMGVGMGEAGCTPPAASLISDYYPAAKRSTALGYYAMGVTLGGLLANLIGGPITDAFGWRMAFLILGLPGLGVALLLKLTVREPPRGFSDPPGSGRQLRPRFIDGLRELASKPSFWTMTAAATIAAFCGYGIGSFQSLFLTRSFDLTAGEAAVMVNTPVALAGALGTVSLGWLAEKLAPRHPEAIAWLAGAGLMLSVPLYVYAFTTQDVFVALGALSLAACVKYGYLAAQYTIAQGVASAQVRALATAILLFIVNLLGYGFGPLFIGALSDLLFSIQVSEFGGANLTRQICEGAGRQALGVAEQTICRQAHAESLQSALLVTALFYALSGLLFLITCRWLRRDVATAGQARAQGETAVAAPA